jgi:hypothetical protein
LEISYDVKAKQSGNSVTFMVAANDIEEALEKAHIEADRIFNYRLGDPSRPTVDVKVTKIKNEE